MVVLSTFLSRYFLVTVALLLSIPQAVEAQDRHAFVFGNGHYSNDRNSSLNLENSVADAEAMIDFLVENKWNVHSRNFGLYSDVSESQMRQVLDRASTGPGDEILLYFSGHGWSDGANYHLVGALPENASVDGDYVSRSNVASNSWQLSDIIRKLEADRPKRIIVIIDACSDQSFRSKSEYEPPNLDFSQFRTEELLVLYSSSPGSFAYSSLKDWNPTDSDPNSVFTRFFLTQLTAAPTLLEAFTRTRIRVEEVTSRQTAKGLPRQIPTVIHDTIDGSFSLLEREPVSAIREAITDPEPQDASLAWRNDPTLCANDKAGLGQAISERRNDTWRNPTASAPARACIRAAALAELGVGELKFNVNNNGLVTFTEASGQLVEAGETVERLVIKFEGVSRPNVKPRPSMSEFLEALEEFAFRDDVLLNSMIAGSGSGPRSLPFRFGEL